MDVKTPGAPSESRQSDTGRRRSPPHRATQIREALRRRLRACSAGPGLWTTLALLFIVGLGAYWRFAVAPSEYGPDSIQSGDVRRYYVSTAESVLAGNGWVPSYNANFLPPPLQTVFVLAVKLIPGSNFQTARYLQAAASVLTIVLAYGVGLHMCRNKLGGTIAAALVAFDPHLVRWVSTLLTETNFFFLFFSFMLALLIGLKKRSALWAGAAGALLGLACLMKSFPLLLLGVLPIYLIVRDRSRSSMRFAATFAGVGMLVIAPWIVRNYLRYGHLYLISTNSGTALAQSNFVGLDAANAKQRYWNDNYRKSAWRSPAIEKRFAGRKDRYGKPEWNEKDRAYQKHFLTYVANNPIHFSRNFVVKLYNIFRYPPDKTKWKTRFREVVLLLGLAGFVTFTYRRRKRPQWVMVPIVVYYALFGALFHLTSSGRINLPLKILFSFFAAYGLAEVAGWFGRRRAADSIHAPTEPAASKPDSAMSASRLRSSEDAHASRR